MQPLLWPLLRKGSRDIVFMLLLNKTLGISGIARVMPFADRGAFAISAAMIVPYLKRLDSRHAALNMAKKYTAAIIEADAEIGGSRPANKKRFMISG